MPNSLKARLKKLKYQGVLSQEDIDRIVILPNAEKVIKNVTTMTNEEAITYANCLKNNYTINFEDMADFCDMAIKALEQEDILDKIRAEIEQMPSELTIDGRGMIRRESVFRIIDKYREGVMKNDKF